MSDTKKIKVILWDIDGTFLNFKKAQYAALHSCFRSFGLGHISDEMIADYSAINDGYWKRLELGELTRKQVLVGRFEEFLSKYGYDPAIAEQFDSEYQIRLGDTICFYENSLETLKKLSGRVRQYAVTNGTRVSQERKLKRSGMDKIFDGIFISEELGTEKPSPLFFEKVFDSIGSFRPDEVMIVGDSLTSDMQGGVNMGIRTCWFNPDGEVNDRGLHIDYEIGNIAEVAKIIEE